MRERREQRRRNRPGPEALRVELPIWRQALTGIGLVTVGALSAVAVGLAMAAVLSWLF